MLKNFGGVPVLKFVQRLALDFPYCLSVIFREMYEMYRKFKKWF